MLRTNPAGANREVIFLQALYEVSSGGKFYRYARDGLASFCWANPYGPLQRLTKMALDSPTSLHIIQLARQFRLRNKHETNLTIKRQAPETKAFPKV